jgi:hypothetical protein
MARVASFRYASLPSYLGPNITLPPDLAAHRSATMTTTRRNDVQTFALAGGLSASFAVGLGLVVAIEGAVLHLWVASRSQAWAWAITALNIITLAWLWREYKAGTRARLVLSETDVEIDAGSRLRCRFPRSLIASAEAATWRSVPDFASDFANTANPLDPNVVLVLREPVNARVALGITKRVSRIGLRLSDHEGVVALLR